MLQLRTILHPTDFSRNSEYAWHLACALARDHGAKLLLVHVKSVPVVMYASAALTQDVEDEELLRRRLELMEPTDPRLTVERFLLQGDAASSILEFARDQETDMIVLGSHGRTGLSRVLVGSVAEVVARKSHCPVMIVKNPVPEVEAGLESTKSPAFVT